MTAIGVIVLVLAALGAIINPLVIMRAVYDETVDLAILGALASFVILILATLILAIGG